MKIPCTLTIAGSDSGGGAGIQADLKTFASLGVHGLSVITALTAQNTLGVHEILEVPTDFVDAQLKAVLSDFEVSWAKTGMLYSPATIRLVRRRAKEHDLKLVVDPVMISTTGHSLLREEASNELKQLVSQAELVTPNIMEAEVLSGVRIRNLKDVERAARKILGLGAKAVLVKGGHLKTKNVVDVLVTRTRIEKIAGPRMPAGGFHGAGCSFSAAITAELAKGKSLIDAAKSAREFIRVAIENSLDVGKGVKPVNPTAKLVIEAEIGKLMREVWAAAKLLESEPSFAELIPEVGVNIAGVIPGAKDRSGSVGLSGRIVKVSGKPRVTGFPEIGGSEHVANLVLAAHRLDPSIRAGINVKFSKDVLRICRKIGLSIGSFERRREPRGVKTMIWGVEEVARKTGRVPRIIYDEGGIGKEPMVRILGSSPLEVAEIAILISKNYKKVLSQQARNSES